MSPGRLNNVSAGLPLTLAGMISTAVVARQGRHARGDPEPRTRPSLRERLRRPLTHHPGG
jgi:hypothetical protein